MEDNRDIRILAGSADELIYVSPHGPRGPVIYYLGAHDGPNINTDRERAVLRALLELALRRLIQQEKSEQKGSQ